MGQGNCTIVKSPNKQDVFIIDAGSKKCPKNIIDTNKIVDKDIIIKSIENWILESRKPPYNIRFIVSHSDGDHKNYVYALLKNFNERGHFNCFYYNHPAFYEDKEWARGSETDKVIGKEYNKYIAERSLFGNYKNPIYSIDELFIYRLNKEFPGGNDANDQSLVLFLKFHGHGILLTGDATGKTFASPDEGEGDEGEDTTPNVDWGLLEESPLNNMVFQASHHGANTHESNSQGLIEIVRPVITVFSAPRHSQYRHPTYQTVERIANQYVKRGVSPLFSLTELYHFFFLDKNMSKQIRNVRLRQIRNVRLAARTSMVYTP